jgi:hypothetical protein
MTTDPKETATEILFSDKSAISYQGDEIRDLAEAYLEAFERLKILDA